MNGEVFKKLNKLKEVKLNKNICVDKDFLGSSETSILQQSINEKCHFDETSLARIDKKFDEAQNVCEFVGESWFNHQVKLKSCWVTQTSIFSDQNGTILAEHDEAVNGLYFQKNQKILYLPKHIDKIFPNLKVYDAYCCSIKEISKQNFENLQSLKVLMLRNNQIEKIMSDTFQGLTNLEIIYLRKNKIILYFFTFFENYLSRQQQNQIHERKKSFKPSKDKTNLRG